MGEEVICVYVNITNSNGIRNWLSDFSFLDCSHYENIMKVLVRMMLKTINFSTKFCGFFLFVPRQELNEIESIWIPNLLSFVYVWEMEYTPLERLNSPRRFLCCCCYRRKYSLYTMVVTFFEYLFVVLLAALLNKYTEPRNPHYLHKACMRWDRFFFPKDNYA